MVRCLISFLLTLCYIGTRYSVSCAKYEIATMKDFPGAVEATHHTVAKEVPLSHRNIRTPPKSGQNLRLGDAHKVANYFITGGPETGHAYFFKEVNPQSDDWRVVPDDVLVSTYIVNPYVRESNNYMDYESFPGSANVSPSHVIEARQLPSLDTVQQISESIYNSVNALNTLLPPTLGLLIDPSPLWTENLLNTSVNQLVQNSRKGHNEIPTQLYTSALSTLMDLTRSTLNVRKKKPGSKAPLNKLFQSLMPTSDVSKLPLQLLKPAGHLLKHLPHLMSKLS